MIKIFFIQLKLTKRKKKETMIKPQIKTITNDKLVDSLNKILEALLTEFSRVTRKNIKVFVNNGLPSQSIAVTVSAAFAYRLIKTAFDFDDYDIEDIINDISALIREYHKDTLNGEHDE